MDKKEEFYIIDTHAHYDDDAFNEDRDELLNELNAAGIKRVVNIAASMESVESSLLLAHKYDFVYAAVGVHPSYSEEINSESIAKLEKMLSDEKCVAIGEIGLDYYYDEPQRQIQKKAFIAQLELAKKYDYPVVIHCYSYSKEMAREFIKLGYVLGIGGVVTFKNAKKLEETMEDISFDDFVLETDCPYLSPVPNRGKRNSSLNLTYIVDRISEIKGVSRDFIIEKTFENARKLYPKMK